MHLFEAFSLHLLKEKKREINKIRDEYGSREGPKIALK